MWREGNWGHRPGKDDGGLDYRVVMKTERTRHIKNTVCEWKEPELEGIMEGIIVFSKKETLRMMARFFF